MNNHEDPRSAPPTPSSPNLGIGFLGSLFWSHADDKCKKHHKRKSSNKSKSHTGYLARRPRYYEQVDPPQNQHFYHQEPKKKTKDARYVTRKTQDIPRKTVESNPLSTSMPENVSRAHTPPPVESIMLSTSFPGFSTSPRRRVHFSLDDLVASPSPSAKKKDVSHLPWTNHKGTEGAYTGQVNENIQHHGSGADGKSTTCIWSDGVPVQGLKPKSPKKNLKKLDHDHQEGHQHQLRSSHTSSASCDTYLHHLDLGDAATPQDMQEDSDPVKIDSLQVHAFAFILRSDGEWTYSIIADRQDDGILFVVDTEGSRKMLSRKHWSTRIRLVNTTHKNTAPKPQVSPASVSRLPDEDDTKITFANPIETCPPPPCGQSSSDGVAVMRPKKDIRRPPPPAIRQSYTSIDGVLSLFD